MQTGADLVNAYDGLSRELYFASLNDNPLPDMRNVRKIHAALLKGRVFLGRDPDELPEVAEAEAAAGRQQLTINGNLVRAPPRPLQLVLRALCPRSVRAIVRGMNVEAIKEAIAGLPEDDRHSLAAWLNDLDYDAWDRQMVKDFTPGGRGMAWAERVRRQIDEGKASPMEDGFAKRGSPQS